MATMKLSVLRYLVAFADEGTFSRAAERCHVSQPTLSVAVQNLEDELGVRLIERGKGHAALTPVGERVVAQARRVLEETRRIETVAEGGRDHLGGEFRLGVIHTVAPYLLPELIGAMRSLAPDARLFIEESMTSLLIDALKYGKVDAVIVALPFDQPGVCVRPLYDEPFRVVVPRAHAWAERREIRARDLREVDLLVLKAGNCFREQVLDACPEISHADGALREGHSIETVHCMVASGYGVSVLPAGALTGLYRSDLVVSIPFAGPSPMRRIALAWREDQPRTRLLAALVEAAGRARNPGFLHLATLTAGDACPA